MDSHLSNFHCNNLIAGVNYLLAGAVRSLGDLTNVDMTSPLASRMAGARTNATRTRGASAVSRCDEELEVGETMAESSTSIQTDECPFTPTSNQAGLSELVCPIIPW